MNKFEQMLNQKVAELEKDYEKTLYKELGIVALNFDSVKVISTMMKYIDFNNKSTNKVFEMYKTACTNIGIPYMANVEFSRFIVKWFGFVIADKKIGGVKYRIFVKIPDAVQDEDESSRLVQDAVQDEKL
jgi:hypothetical protein